MPGTLVVEHARSDRSKCKKCAGGVGKGTLRLVVNNSSYHPKCAEEAADDLADINTREDELKLDSFSEDEVSQIKKVLSAIATRAAAKPAVEKKAGRGRKTAAPTKKRVEEDSASEEPTESESEDAEEGDDYDESEDDDGASKKRKRGAAPRKAAARPVRGVAKRRGKPQYSDEDTEEEDEDDDEEEKKPTRKRKAAPAAKKSNEKKKKGSDDEDEDEDAKPAKKRKLPDLVKKGAAAKKNSAGDGIDEVIEEVLSSEPAKSTAKDKLGEIPQKWKEKLAKMTVPQLKILLESNQQVKTGNKGELLNRIVDACINGAFPKCDVCHGGKMKHSGMFGDKEVLKCPGFYDDEKFKHCSNTNYGPRTTWTWLDA